MTPNSIGFFCHTYVTTRCDIVTVECIESEKSEGQTNIQTNKQTNEDKKTIVRRATITREPLSKGDSRTGLIALHIQQHLATLASLTHFIPHTSE